MAQSKSVRLVTEAALDTSQTKALAPIKNDVADLKVLGGLNPGSVNDASTSNLIETPGTQTNASLSAAIDESLRIVPARVIESVRTPSELIANALDFGSGSLRVALAGDSTINDSNDPPRKFLLRLGQIAPAGFGAYEKQFDPVGQSYKSMETLKAGALRPATGGVIMSDTFNRNVSELVGSTSSGGQVWIGDTNSWSADGALAHSTVGPKFLGIDASTSSAKVTAVIDLKTSANPASPNVRLYVASNTALVATSTTAIFAQVAVSSAGIANISIFKKIGNVNTQLGSSDFSIGLDVDSAAAQKATLTLEVATQNVIVTFTPSGGATKTYAPTITESDFGALGTVVGISTSNNALDAVRLDSVSVETAYTPASLSGVEIWNGAVGGSNLPYQQSRINLLYPSATRFDIILITGGHNMGTSTPGSFIAEVDSFIEAFKAQHPETLILISSQNPQKAPSPTVAAHAARQAALRDYAMGKGYEYLPVFEAFTAQEDGGLSMILSDGIHPTYPGHPVANAGLTSLAWEGSVLWASVWHQAIRSRRHTSEPPMTGLPPA